MPYTQEATIRTHYKRLNKFVRLTDYLIVDSKIAMINQSTASIKDHILELNDSNNDKYATVNSLITVEVQSMGSELLFTPNRDMLRRLFDEMVSKSVHRICNKHKMLVNMMELKEYIKIDGSAVEEQQGDDTVDLFGIIH